MRGENMFIWVNKIYYIEKKEQMLKNAAKIAINVDNICSITDKFPYARSECPLAIVMEDMQEIKCVDPLGDVVSQLGDKRDDFAQFVVDVDWAKVPVFINKRFVTSVQGDTDSAEIATKGRTFTVEEAVDSVISKLG